MLQQVCFEGRIPIDAGLHEELPLLTRAELAVMPEHGRDRADDLRSGGQALTHNGLGKLDSLFTGLGSGGHLHKVSHGWELIQPLYAPNMSKRPCPPVGEQGRSACQGKGVGVLVAQRPKSAGQVGELEGVSPSMLMW